MPEQVYQRHVVVRMDNGDKFEVTTNAFDNVGLNAGSDLVDLGVVPIYKALVRCDVPGIPATKRQFIDHLLSVEDLPIYYDADTAGELDPTRPAVSDG